MRNACTIALLPLFALLLAGCASRPLYETEDWSIAVVDGSTAEATVRYEGFASGSEDPAKRAALAEQLRELAEDTTPGSPWTPRLRNARRAFVEENGSLTMVETGELPNPLSWFEQSGFNPVTWFGSDVNISVKDNHVIKWGFSSPNEIVGASGQVMNERDYSAILSSVNHVDLREKDDESWDTEGQTIIVWPGEARAFNWKIASSAYLKGWRSLAPEFNGEVAAEAVQESETSEEVQEAQEVQEPQEGQEAESETESEAKPQDGQEAAPLGDAWDVPPAPAETPAAAPQAGSEEPAVKEPEVINASNVIQMVEVKGGSQEK